MNIRFKYTSAGTNPEISGPFYELIDYTRITGSFNLHSLTLGFNHGEAYNIKFSPIDPKKPVVLALHDGIFNAGFVVFVDHIYGAISGTRTYDLYTTDDYHIDCQSRPQLYWSVKSNDLTFVYGEVSFLGTWKIHDVGLLCAFVAGELTANQLQKESYIYEREEVKERSRQQRIHELVLRLDLKEVELTLANKRWSTAEIQRHFLVLAFSLLTNGLCPFVSRRRLKKVLDLLK